MAGLFGFVTSQTLYSVPERKANMKNVIIQIRKLNLLSSVLKEIEHFSGLQCLQHKRGRERSEILNHVQNCPSNWTKKEKVLGKRELVRCANVAVVFLRIVLIVLKSQVGKHSVCLKIVCIDKTIESNLAFYTTTEVLFGSPTFIL